MSGATQQIQVNGRSVDAYLSHSSRPNAPGVVVIQEWWGLVPHIKTVCDRLAAEGFTALAPDLYHGKTGTGPDEAKKLMMALNIDEAEADIASAIKTLLAQEEVKGEQAGVVGFCMGGMLSLYTACKNQSVGACVDFYGIHPSVKPDLRELSAPLLGFFGAKDHNVPIESVRELEERLRELNKDVEFVIYNDAGHAFFNDTRPEVYDAWAAGDAWEKLIAFYRKHLQ